MPSVPAFSRRGLLTGGLAGLALPWLASLAPREARGATFPTRFLVMFSPNGTIAPQWTPTGGETDFVLSPILAPLAPYRDRLVVIAGVDQRGAGGDGHQKGIGGMLTGQPLNPGPFAGTGAPPAGWAAGPSVDQRIAEVVGRSTPFRSLELGVQVGAANNWGRMCYRAANQPLVPEDDPARVYQRVFGDRNVDPALRASRRARRRSILDAVADDLARVSQRVSSADRQKLDAHLTALRELETRVTTEGAPASAACQDPTGHAPAVTDNDAFPSIGATQMDLLVTALACDITRVGSLQWSRSVSQTRFTWLGITDGHHDLSHHGDDDAGAQDKLTRINTWYAQQLATLLAKLAAVPEGEGTLLDHTLVLWCNELAKGNIHSREDAPYVLAGGAGGGLRTGRFLRYDGDVAHNDLLLALVNAMGIPDTSFGKTDWCQGPLPGLL